MASAFEHKMSIRSERSLSFLLNRIDSPIPEDPIYEAEIKSGDHAQQK